jgi:hypothetical protein
MCTFRKHMQYTVNILVQRRLTKSVRPYETYADVSLPEILHARIYVKPHL